MTTAGSETQPCTRRMAPGPGDRGEASGPRPAPADGGVNTVRIQSGKIWEAGTSNETPPGKADRAEFRSQLGKRIPRNGRGSGLCCRRALAPQPAAMGKRHGVTNSVKGLCFSPTNTPRNTGNCRERQRGVVQRYRGSGCRAGDRAQRQAGAGSGGESRLTVAIATVYYALWHAVERNGTNPWAAQGVWTRNRVRSDVSAGPRSGLRRPVSNAEGGEA